MPAAMFGVLWPDVRERFDQSLGALGTVSLVYGLARMSTSGAGRALTTRFGIGPCFVAGLVALIGADLLTAASMSWVTFLVGVAAIGIVSGLLDSVGAGVIATLGDVGDAGIIHGSYGIGATIGPLAVAVVPGWRWSLVVAAVFAAAGVASAIAVGDRWPAPPPQSHEVEVGSPPLGPTIVSLAAFCSFVALEVTIGNWLFTYLTESRSIGDGVAAVTVAGYWAGTMTGRLALGSERLRGLADRIGMVPCAVAAALGVITVVVVPSWSVVVATAFTGLMIAPLVPTLSARTARRVGVAHAQHVAGWQLLAANVGAIGVPFLTGLIVDRTGPGAVVVVIVCVLVVGIPILVTARRLPVIDAVDPGPGREIATASPFPS